MVRIDPVDVSDERVALGSGVSLPVRWTAVLEGEPGVPGTIRVLAVYEPDLGRAVAAEVRVSRAGAQDEITSLTLREVRVQFALQASGLLVSTVSEPNHPEVSGAGYIMRMQERPERDVQTSVTDAARTYQLAASISLPPLKAVADALGVSQSTASRLMNRARLEGLASAGIVPDPSATGPVVGQPGATGPDFGR